MGLEHGGVVAVVEAAFQRAPGFWPRRRSARASSSVRVSGFSQSTSLPASSAAIADLGVRVRVGEHQHHVDAADRSPPARQSVRQRPRGGRPDAWPWLRRGRRRRDLRIADRRRSGRDRRSRLETRADDGDFLHELPRRALGLTARPPEAPGSRFRPRRRAPGRGSSCCRPGTAGFITLATAPERDARGTRATR